MSKKKPYRRTCSNCGKVRWQETNEPDCHVLLGSRSVP